MRGQSTIWAVAGAAATCTIVSCVVDIVVAYRVDEPSTLRSLLIVAFVLQIIAVVSIAYFCLIFQRKNKKTTTPIPWIEPSHGAGFNTIALILTGAAIIYYVTKYREVRTEPFCYQAVGLTAWVLSVLSQGAFFVLLIMRTRKLASMSVPQVLVSNLGTTHPSQRELVLEHKSSFYSRGTTLVSRSCTPTSPRTHSLHSSTTRAASSIRSKFTRHSARSSLDEIPSVPVAEISFLATATAAPNANAFDRYDTSNVDSDVRNTVLSSSPTAARSGLATIPGSRPTSPGDTLTKEEMLPTSPKYQKQKQTQESPESVKTIRSDHIPSSPPNFSRPTSRSQHRPTLSASSTPHTFRQPRPSASMTDLIHPLFRPDSPSPPQILTSGTMVTASPLANQPITPKTLSRLRSTSDLVHKNAPALPKKPSSSSGQWRVMPPIEPSPSVAGLRQRSKSVTTQRPSTSGTDTFDETHLIKTETMGSPGPSIVEDEELPPILPGFVLSAGSRSSLVGYGKRKSVKRVSSHLS